jgi:hypothetical protein
LKSIVNDELHFDYKLRDGICKIKATFLMKKSYLRKRRWRKVRIESKTGSVKN